MAKYAKDLRAAVGVELARLQLQGSVQAADMQIAKRWLHRDEDKIPSALKARVANAAAASPALLKLVAMREELRQLWTRGNVSAEQLVPDLQTWLRKAEESGIASLQEFALRLRAARA